MSELQMIESVLLRTAKRRRWQRAWRGLWNGLLAGGVFWLIVLVVYKLAPIPYRVVEFAGILSGLCVLGGFIAGWARKPTLLETARWLDLKESLQERLSTALEISAKPDHNRWNDLVLADAARSLQAIDPKKLLPFQLPRTTRWAFVTLLLAVGLGFVPEYRTKAHVQREKDAEVIQDTGRQLAEFTRRSLEQRPPALEPTRESLEAVAELGDHLAKAKLTRSEALRDLASATEKLKEEAREIANNPALKALERAARSSSQGGPAGSADLQKKIEALQKALGDKAADSEALEQLKRELQKAKEAAAGLNDLNAAARDSAQEQLAQTLSDLAEKAKDLGISLPSLEEAIAALAASQAEKLMRDLEVAEIDLEKLSQMAKTLERLQAQAETLGKNLAEQLEYGQTQAAQATLKKMEARLKEGNLTSEELEKMTEELSQAVDPAGQYGKAAEFLKQAAQQCTGGEPGDAARSVAAAASELENLMQQLSDAEALLASLQALQHAQMCIGNGQGWSDRGGPPRANKGGGIGSGVGTWADDSRWMDITDIKDRWDNSGVVRPDEDPRGITDRGDGQVPDTIVPTKVKGQMNAGGPMPSVTLKGVSIKGMSKVDFQETVATAQSDAQSAISQEQVPRAYRGAVRDYFDDLRE